MSEQKGPITAPGTISAKMTYTANGKSIDYMVFLPNGWSSEQKDSYPLLLFLHGAGGLNNEDNIRGQSLTRNLADKKFIDKFPFVVITPILPVRPWMPYNELLLSLVKTSLVEFNGDSKRVYLAGQSMGGNGAWMLGAQFPATFAAISPCCGFVADGDESKVASSLSSKPVYVFHSADDTVVSVEKSDVMVKALQAEGSKIVEYTRYETAPPAITAKGPLAGHGSFELAFGPDSPLFAWLLKHKLE